ncbi:reverse transcriptase-like protein [Oxalobacteraceae bacterium]|nr:reverse transcriptase-like protein [Oxalobacteraceae bacterium]
MSESEHTWEALSAAAFKGERVLARRLAARSGVSELQALRHMLIQAAGAGGLDALLAERSRLLAADAARRAAKMEQKMARRQQQLAHRRPPAGVWQGWFDGSAHPNPGRLGIGALLLGPQGERVAISRRAGYGNSGEAEYLALIALLEAAAPLQPAQLLIHGDSQVVINDVNGREADGAIGLEALRARSLALMATLADVRLAWLPRHRNGAADLLSQQAIASWQQEQEQQQQ